MSPASDQGHFLSWPPASNCRSLWMRILPPYLQSLTNNNSEIYFQTIVEETGILVEATCRASLSNLKQSQQLEGLWALNITATRSTYSLWAIENIKTWCLLKGLVWKWEFLLTESSCLILGHCSYWKNWRVGTSFSVFCLFSKIIPTVHVNNYE